jgi:hypothetical protein
VIRVRFILSGRIHVWSSISELADTDLVTYPTIITLIFLDSGPNTYRFGDLSVLTGEKALLFGLRDTRQQIGHGDRVINQSTSWFSASKVVVL